MIFPYIKPNVNPDPHGWFGEKNKSFLKPLVADKKIILELGSWLGKSTRWFLDNSKAANILCVDTWKGSIEHQTKKGIDVKLPNLLDTFVVNCWNYRHKILYFQKDTISGMKEIHDLKIMPDFIYVDASHQYEDVLNDLQTAYDLFPNALICGDDWSWKNKSQEKRRTVRQAVYTFCINNGLKVTDNGHVWMIIK